ncbi:MAG: hypothetical protein ACOYX1_18715 [Acidobacteriota bacterium]
MWQKLGLAFLAGGIAVGTVVYLGLKDRQAQMPAQPAPLVQAPAPAPEPVPAAEAREVAPPEPAGSEKPAAAAPRPKVEPPRLAASRPPRPPASSRQAAKKVEVAQIAPPAEHHQQAPAPQDVRVLPPPAPAPSPQESVQAAKPATVERPVPPKREPRTVTLPAGTLVTVRLRDALSTERHSAHDAFYATLDAPLIVEGLVIAERGAMVRGRVVEAIGSGRVKGRAALVLQLDELTTSDGQKVEIRTDAFRHEAESGVKGDVAKTGVAAGIGAAIGAIAGGGRGAAIGAAIGGAAGAGGAMATRGKPAELPSETRLTFRLSEPLTLTEKLP